MLLDDMLQDWGDLEKYGALRRTCHRKLRQDHAAMGATIRRKVSTARATASNNAPSYVVHKRSAPEITTPRAAQKAFTINEIVTNILLFLDPVTVVGIERVNNTCHSAIDESPLARFMAHPATAAQRTDFLLSRPNASVSNGICIGNLKTFEQNYRQHRERTGQVHLRLPLEGCPRFVYGF